MRVLHINTHATDSTIYNYQTNKNIYWGETNDLGMYYFRGRFVAIQSNLGIGTTNPTTLLQMNSNGANFVKFTSASNASGFWVGIDDTNTINGIGAFVWNSSNAHIKFGTNNLERMRLLSNGKLTLGSVDPLSQVGGLYEIADGGSNNQFVLYNNSNNRHGMYINTSNAMIRLAGYDWTNTRAVHMMLQDAGCNLSIGQANSAPLSLMHIRNNTTSNNLLIEAGRTSEGANEGLTTINFNGYSLSGDRRITTNKNRWRLFVDQRSTAEYMGIDAFNGSTLYNYMTLSNLNFGINKPNPIGRLHVLGAAITAGADGTASSNNSLTLEDSAGLVRVVYLSSHVTDSTVYNYQTAKNVYWGELGDTGMYYFRGRHVAISSNLGINTTNPSQRLEVNGNVLLTSAGSIFCGGQLTIQPNTGNLVFNTNTVGNNTIFQSGGVERARLSSAGTFLVGTSTAAAGAIFYGYSNHVGGLYGRIENANNGTTSLSGQVLVNNTGNGCWWWLNSSTRTGDGPANCATIRNDAGDLRLAGASTQSFIFLQTSTNRVGINTASPASTLDVAGSSRFGGQMNMAVDVWHTSTDNRNRLHFGNNSHTYYQTADWHVWRNSGGADHMYLTSGGSLYVTVGNVGIGTSSPSYKLHVMGDVYANGGWLRASGNNGFYCETWGGGWHMTDTTWMRSYNNKSVYTPGNFRADGNLQYGGGDRTISNPTGDYGSLQTNGTGNNNWEGFSIRGDYVFMSADGNQCGIFNDVNNDWIFYFDRADNNNRWCRLHWNGGERLTTNSLGVFINGRLGVGTGSPSYAIHTTGDVYANGGWMRVSGNAGYYFESWGGGWNMTDGTWIRAVNDKNIYTGGAIQCGGGFNGNLNGTASYATNAGYANSTNYANSAGSAGSANYANSAGSANYANSSGSTNYANSAGSAGSAGGLYGNPTITVNQILSTGGNFTYGGARGYVYMGDYNQKIFAEYSAGIYIEPFETSKPFFVQQTSGNVFISKALSKGSGSFDIPHPDPVKKEQGYRLRHCFVESPTRGDNIYRYEIDITSTSTPYRLSLPDYFHHLNEDPQLWMNPKNFFGQGYGMFDPDLKYVDLFVNQAGVYNIMIIATRKDEIAREFFDKDGIEYIRDPKLFGT
jgi:hypothetical protein